MKIVVFEQENCGWCTRLHPHIKKLATDSAIDIETVDITGKWELAEQFQFRSTPTVIIVDNDVILRKFSIRQDRGVSGLISEIKDFISE